MEQIRIAFDNVDLTALNDHPFLVLDDTSDFCCGFIQALRQKNGYWVEFRHGQTSRHYRTPGLITREAALALFVEFLESGTAVLDGHDWRDVTEAVKVEVRRRGPSQ
jgi:hypothetical protein